MITIINYGSGNINAISNIYETLKIPYNIATSPSDLNLTKKIILPGVGAFDETIRMLHNSGFIEILNKLVLDDKVPVLGICVGMQIMADSSEEGSSRGLGWIKGEVKKFEPEKILYKPKFPHLGWNSITSVKESKLLNNINQRDGFYFIHSYYYKPTLNEDILTTTNYGIDFASAINRDNIYGVQFHPEKSHKNGVKLLNNFFEL